MDNLGAIFLAGKSLKELGFPEDWEYEGAWCRWRSEKHTTMVTPGQSKIETGLDWGTPYKAYFYITDKMLFEGLRP